MFVGITNKRIDTSATHSEKDPTGLGTSQGDRNINKNSQNEGPKGAICVDITENRFFIMLINKGGGEFCHFS